MKWTNRVVWQEGMFLRTRHFQQQDRWVQKSCAAGSRPCARIPGASSNTALTATFWPPAALPWPRPSACSRTTIFVLPGEADHPPPLELPDNARNVLVYLALPIRQDGAMEVGDDATAGRYHARLFEAYDTQSASPQPAELQVGRLNMRYLLDTDERAGYRCIALARVTEVTAEHRVMLDERWIPPALVCSAAMPLAGLITEMTGMLNQRGDALAARMADPGQAGVAQVSDFLLLQSINGWQNVLAHWADAGNVHPELLYTTMVQMAGEFSTFLETRRPPNDTRPTATTTCSAASARSSPTCAGRCPPCWNRPLSRSRCANRAMACGSARSTTVRYCAPPASC